MPPLPREWPDEDELPRPPPLDSGSEVPRRSPGWGAGLFEALLLYSSFWLKSLFPGLGSGGIGLPTGPADPAWQYLILLNLIPAGALLLWIMGRGEGFAAFGLDLLPHPRDFAGAVAILGILLGLGLLPDALLRIFGAGFALPSWLDNPLVDSLSRAATPRIGLVPLILVSSLVTGYVEELYFRVYLSTRLGRAGLGRVARVGLTSLLFGLSHGASQGLAAALIAAILGAILALRWEAAKSWHEIGLGHGLYDFAVLMALLYF